MYPQIVANVLHNKRARVILLLVFCAISSLVYGHQVNAGGLGLSPVNGASGQNATTATSIVSTPTYVPNPGEQFIVVCSANTNSTLSLTSSNSALTSSITIIQNHAGTGASLLTAKIIPTITPGTNDVASTITCNGTTSASMSMVWFRIYGVNLASVASGTTNATLATWSSGTIANTYGSNSFGMAFVTSNIYSALTNAWDTTNGNWSSWFAMGTSSGQTARRSTLGGAYAFGTSTASYGTSINSGVTAAPFRGHIVTFSTADILQTDIVNAALTPIASPTVAMTSRTTGFSCQTSTGTLGSAAQKIMVHTNIHNWNLSIAPTAGTSALWTSGGNTYDFNDPSGSGCTNGQLTLNFSSANWSNSINDCPSPELGMTQASGTYSYSSGTTDAITIMSTNNPASPVCRRFVHSIGLSQTIPAEKIPGTYTLPMTLTVTAI